ncbi:MAG: DUF1926 domain-containing protein [Treponema sp.]|nr:DUF1926 domain-containing protein [Candidatus Treponema equifaecale]
MKKLNICLYVTASSSILSHSTDFEAKYDKIYKKIVSFMFENTMNKMAVSFTGPVFSWIQREHSEYTQLLSKINNRKQTEVLGGGYYNPIFPLLFPQDRTGQIELLTSEIRHAIGKRPRGMTTFNSTWDSSLIPCFNSCGMEYVLLDSSLIPKDKRFYLPLIASEQGKSICILPVNREFIPNTLVEPREYLRNLFDTVNYLTKDDEYNSLTEERVLTIRIDENQFAKLHDSKWLEKLYTTAQEYFSDTINITLPLEYLHRAETKVPTYIPAGIQSNVAIWARSPYKAQDNVSNFQTTVFDFLLTYKRNHALYNRMLYISMLINQCKGDKARKKIAREKLWIAQSGEGYVCDPSGVFANNQARQYAYRNLTEAEKLCREAAGQDNFKESVTNYDYNSDGHSEYVCSMKQHTTCISPRGGQISELDIIHNCGNYADSPSRMRQFDKCDDNYERGLFIDHLFTADEYAEYKKGTPSGNGIFSQVLYREEDFDAYRHELKMIAKGTYSQMNVEVSLRKKFIANSNGYMIQYILKNEGPFDIKGHLVIESNFAQTDFSSAKANSYKVEVISNGEKNEIDAKESSKSLKKISYIQLTDTSNDISFVYEPNEDCDLVCMPIIFRRPSSTSDNPQISGTAFVTSLAWNVELPAGMEMEKTINFSIIVPKKRRTKK